MSARSPYERFNVFDTPVQNELRKRRTSVNLLEVRSPFLRYTTAVELPTKEWYTDIANNPGALNIFNYIAPYNLNRYVGCKFFTLGLHGWDNEYYSDQDIYGLQNNQGAVVGITYKDNRQILVRTSDLSSDAKGQTLGERFESPQGYPPPGIESAKIERLRNGNVLRFTVNAVCYTQQQLSMLDLLAFSPGMTCILEWGNIISTPYGTRGLQSDKILNFKNVAQTEEDIQEILDWHKGGLTRKGITRGARTKFIEKYCATNDFHYDFTVARIANVKTNIEDNKYRVTVVAYGVADNIMYISAYATNNPDFQEDTKGKESADKLITSVREYFAPKQKFTVLLDSLVAQKDVEVVKFDEPDDAQFKNGPSAAAGSGTATNDLGQEQTFYITLNKFIKFFLNDPSNGIASIVNGAINITDASKSKNDPKYSLEILEDLTHPVDGPLSIGYNSELRSTDPSTVLIVNPTAIRKLTTPQLNMFRSQLNITNKGQVRTSQALTTLRGNELTQINAKGQPNKDGNPAGIARATSGVWLNSKMIQAVFLEARTIHEGIETMLKKINAATEGYWDLSLVFDEENNNFRIMDNNLKIPPETGADVIYTFNKRLPNNTSAADEILGPEVLNISVNADYPKLLVSQLGISAINNSSGVVNRTDLQYARNPLLGPRLWDMFRKEAPSKKEDKKTPPAPNTGTTTLNKFVDEVLKSSLYDIEGSRSSIKGLLQEANFDKLPTSVRQTLNTVFSLQRPLTREEAQGYASQLSVGDLTDTQVNSIKRALALRTKAIVIREKTAELRQFTGPGGTGGFDSALSIKTKDVDVSKQLNEIKRNIENSKQQLLSYIDTASTPTIQTSQNAPSRPNELRPSQQIATVPGAIR